MLITARMTLIFFSILKLDVYRLDQIPSRPDARADKPQTGLFQLQI